MKFDNSIRNDFPIFKHQPNLVYLDSTASTLKPQQVIDAVNEYYQEYSANIFRGIYDISEKATAAYEDARKKIAEFMRVIPDEVVFVRNATEGINLVASSWGDANIHQGDEIVTTIMEHHANFVTWQALATKKQAKFIVIDLNQDGTIDQKELLDSVSNKTKLVALAHVSNVLGTINPIKELAQKIKAKNPNCVILVDGAQAVPHMPVAVGSLGVDFYAFSGHKMLGPTGIGVLWGRFNLLDVMTPYQYGGEMIEAVYKDHTRYKRPPHKFEAGTPHIAGSLGLGAAVDYLAQIGMENVRSHEQDLTTYALEKLAKIEQISILGSKNSSIRGGVISFTIPKIHPHDIAQVLSSNNICIRSGHHCAMPLHTYFDIPASARMSFYIYTSRADIDVCIQSLQRAISRFS
ncbi:SufS family cysteine desulfurase [Candidatus Microgenomates bacterium]|nr:MAG: SufS family cysteine desulfurase [Candidatus Microgenomates bacterium]